MRFQQPMTRINLHLFFPSSIKIWNSLSDDIIHGDLIVAGCSNRVTSYNRNTNYVKQTHDQVLLI